MAVLDTTTHQPIGKWHIPGGGSPDMGGVSADGKQLWLSGRYHNEVYVFDWTTPGLLEAVGSGKDERHGSSEEVPGGVEGARGGDGA
ncbi:YncE family protein [Saccharopolyspora sp. ASAGF58]|uniref:YncE family protein n=1 Tax=Saccharopolyspora sp. ASAGF58 TaxID=2719023 RepID=UPI0014455897|nr:hypothetical protein [Saccharopolyspora sp. ASAGF58]